MTTEILSIGHSTLDYEEFLKLIRRASVTAIADVRSYPFSRHFPQFDSDSLKEELRLDNVAYVPLGAELGGRPTKPELFCEGIANYEKMAEEKSFKAGIQRILTGSKKFRIALMCSEHNPLDCHRCLMVGRVLSEMDTPVKHILSNGAIVSQIQIEEQLLKEYGHGGEDMFAKGRARIIDAYRERSRQVAYRASDPQDSIIAAE